MVIILEILKRVGIEKIFEIIFIPPLKLFGIQKEAMNIIIVGMTIGIQYGGGMLIKDVKSGKIDKQSVFLSVSLLNLLHAIIEDTILMALIGGHISGILFARIIFSLIVSVYKGPEIPCLRIIKKCINMKTAKDHGNTKV